jgi:hypothetical protein
MGPAEHAHGGDRGRDTLAVGLLALAAFGQAIVQADALAGGAAARAARSGSTADAVLVLWVVPLCLLGLAATVPLIFLRPRRRRRPYSPR